jgi:hypothetical protein
MGTYGPTWILKDMTYRGMHHHFIQDGSKSIFVSSWPTHILYFDNHNNMICSNLYILKFDNKSQVIYYNWELSNWSSIMWKLSKIIFIAQWRNSKVLVNLAIDYFCKLKEYWNYFFILPLYLLKCGIEAMQLLYINIWHLSTRWTCVCILKKGSFLPQNFCIMSKKKKKNHERLKKWWIWRSLFRFLWIHITLNSVYIHF